MIGKTILHYLMMGAILLIAFISPVSVLAQITFERTYGGIDVDSGVSVQQTSDGGYIIAGDTYSFGAGGYDVYLIKTDASGDTMWTRTYGDTNDDIGLSVQLTTDCGYVIAGYTKTFGVSDREVYLIKTDADGDTLWTRTYGGIDLDEGISVQQTSDEGYVIAGCTCSFGAGSIDVYLIKTDANGDTLWTRTYGGTDDDIGFSVQLTTDGGYVIAGETYSFGDGKSDVYLIKTDASGWTPVEADYLKGTPSSFNLSQNYPNPFNPETTIRYQLPKEEKVALVIYNMMGQEVRRLVDVKKKAGNYEVVWDGRDEYKKIVGAGMYLLCMQSGSFTQTRKLLLLK